MQAGTPNQRKRISIPMVTFLKGALRNFGGYSWEMLVLPLGAHMLAASVRGPNLK